MRVSLIAIGIVVAIAGAVVLEYPLFPQGACSGTVANNTLGTPGTPPPVLCQVKSELLPINLVVSWTANGSGVLEVAICSQAHNVSIGGETVTGVSGCSYTVTQSSTGSSGSGSTGTISATSGEYLIVFFDGYGSTGPNGAVAKVTTKSTQPLVGLPLLVLGILFVLVGMILGKKSPPAKSSTKDSSKKASKDASDEKPAEESGGDSETPPSK